MKMIRGCLNLKSLSSCWCWIMVQEWKCGRFYTLKISRFRRSTSVAELGTHLGPPYMTPSKSFSSCVLMLYCSAMHGNIHRNPSLWWLLSKTLPNQWICSILLNSWLDLYSFDMKYEKGGTYTFWWTHRKLILLKNQP